MQVRKNPFSQVSKINIEKQESNKVDYLELETGWKIRGDENGVEGGEWT